MVLFLSDRFYYRPNAKVKEILMKSLNLFLKILRDYICLFLMYHPMTSTPYGAIRSLKEY